MMIRSVDNVGIVFCENKHIKHRAFYLSLKLYILNYKPQMCWYSEVYPLEHDKKISPETKN